MDIDKIWNELKTSSLDHDKIDKNMILQSIHQESHSAIAALKKALKAKINYVIAFIILFSIWTFYNYDNTQLVILMSTVNAIYILAYFLIRHHYKKMIEFEKEKLPLLQNMKLQLRLIKKTLFNEMSLFTISLPLILLFAILYTDVSKGFTIIEAFNAGDNLRAFAIYTLCATPLLYLIGSYMNKISYGKDIQRLERSIEELESIN